MWCGVVWCVCSFLQEAAVVSREHPVVISKYIENAKVGEPGRATEAIDTHTERERERKGKDGRCLCVSMRYDACVCLYIGG